MPRERKGMEVGRQVQEPWKSSRYELRADVGVGVGGERGRGSHGHCYKIRTGRK